jgi:hypothetical protein
MKAENKTSYIYALCDPINKDIRYIGKSTDPQKRLRTHIDRSKSPKTHKECWITHLTNLGLKPEIVILEIIPAFTDWEICEKQWIIKAKEEGWELTNLTEGGDGGATTRGRSPWNAGKHGIFSEDALRRISENSKRKRSPETRRRMSESCKKREKTPGLISAQQKASAARKGQAPWNKGKHAVQSYGPQSEDHRRKISEARKEYWKRWRIEHHREEKSNGNSS